MGRPSAGVDRTAHRALIASVTGYAMDGFDLLILGFLLTPMAADLKLSAAQSGSLVTSTLTGAVAGGIVFGVLGDRYGRVRVLSWTILLFAFFTGMCALAQGYKDLIAYRSISGFGLGGEFGLGMTLVAETWPASMRARVSSYVAMGWQAGVLMAALLTPVLLPILGWRGMWAFGLLPAVVSFAIRRSVREPAIFLSRSSEAETATSFMLRPWMLLVRDARRIRTSVAMLILCSIQNFGYYGIIIWMPNHLSKNLGYSLTKSSMWTAATVVGMTTGIWIFGQLADRSGRKPTFLIYQAGAAASVMGYAQLSDGTMLLVGGAVMGIFINGMVGGYGTLLSELYPTEARASAQNILFNLGRAVGGLGPVVVGVLSVHHPFAVTASLLASLYIIAMATTYWLIPEKKGMSLE